MSSFTLPLESSFELESPGTCFSKTSPGKSKNLPGTTLRPGISADIALRNLLDGNSRFVSRVQAHDLRTNEYGRSLVDGQQPHSIVVTCSDSRVPPEIVFDQGLGDLFVIRSAGAVVDSMGLASIEFAVQQLQCSLLVILGHQSCGAVQSAFENEWDTSSQHFNCLMSKIRPHVETFTEDTVGEKLENAVCAQVRGSACDIIQSSESLRAACLSGRLHIATALYMLESGFVEFF